MIAAICLKRVKLMAINRSQEYIRELLSLDWFGFGLDKSLSRVIVF